MEPVEGVLRVLRDVIVHRESDQEWIAIGREPAVVGEILMLDVEERGRRLTMCVIESRPSSSTATCVTEFGCTAASCRQSCLNSRSGAAEPRRST